MLASNKYTRVCYLEPLSQHDDKNWQGFPWYFQTLLDLFRHFFIVVVVWFYLINVQVIYNNLFYTYT